MSEVAVARTPAGERQWTAAQEAHRERFGPAALCGRAVLADPATRALYEAADGAGQPAVALAVGGFLNAPVVDVIDLSARCAKTGDKTAVRAQDDLALTGVAVAIRNSAGQVVEQGAAGQRSDSIWTYTATKALPIVQIVSIEVTATDRPGHKPIRTQAKSARHRAWLSLLIFDRGSHG